MHVGIFFSLLYSGHTTKCFTRIVLVKQCYDSGIVIFHTLKRLGEPHTHKVKQQKQTLKPGFFLESKFHLKPNIFHFSFFLELVLRKGELDCIQHLTISH